jgi:Family of unknown function (DUF5985)
VTSCFSFLNGLSACGSLIAGVLFVRFWRDTRERLFLWFGLAFWMFALNWTAMSLLQPVDEARSLYFLPRLIGLVLILVAIGDKNRRPAQ